MQVCTYQNDNTTLIYLLLLRHHLANLDAHALSPVFQGTGANGNAWYTIKGLIAIQLLKTIKLKCTCCIIILLK